MPIRHITEEGQPLSCAWRYASAYGDARGEAVLSYDIPLRTTTSHMADDLHRGSAPSRRPEVKILDRNGTVIAANRTVCTVSVVHSQVTEPERVIEMLCAELGLSEEECEKKVEKRSSREIIKTNVDKETGR